MLKIEMRSYNSEQFRPTPLVYEDHEKKFVLILTSWGASDYTQKVMDHLSDYIQTALADVEVTSPFEFIPTLSKECNILRIASLLANSFVNREINAVEYVAGYELVGFIQNKNKISWVQVGMPEIYKANQGRLIPLEVSPSFDSIPLPDQLLGLELTCSPKTADIHIDDSGPLVLISRSQLDGANAVVINSELSLKNLVYQLSKESPESAFWASFLNFFD